jgi:hypothetical protein
VVVLLLSGQSGPVVNEAQLAPGLVIFAVVFLDFEQDFVDFLQIVYQLDFRGSDVFDEIGFVF